MDYLDLNKTSRVKMYVTPWSHGSLGTQKYLVECLENNANVRSSAVCNG